MGGPFIAFDGFEKPNDDDVTSVFVALIQDGFREAENPFGQFGIPVLDKTPKQLVEYVFDDKEGPCVDAVLPVDVVFEILLDLREAFEKQCVEFA